MKVDKLYYTYDSIDIKWLSPKKLIETIDNAIKKYGEDNVSFEVDIEKDRYTDSEYPAAYLQCKRNMTEKEIEKRKYEEREQQQRREAIEREAYLILKKKYEK